MTAFEAVQHVSVTILRSPAEVYAFVASPENLPRWAAGLSAGIRRVDDEWVSDSPMGAVKVRFAAPNPLGVLDHDVTLPSGETVHNPLRVIPNGSASELTFAVFRRPGMTEQEFAADVDAVRRDLAALKRLLEGAA